MITLYNTYSPSELKTAQYTDLKDLIQEYVYVRKLPKKETLLTKGSKCNNIYFVINGLIKQNSFSNKSQKVDKLFLEGTIATDLDSLLARTKSKISLEAAAGTELWVMDYENFHKLINKNPSFKNLLLSSVKKIDESREKDFNYQLLMALYKNLENVS
ncbi:cyclic nucleotide-binding domain-containing protein [Aureispira]|nr:cyclic nucleotide-binding domain-containing protein [Aureispira sp.]